MSAAAVRACTAVAELERALGFFPHKFGLRNMLWFVGVADVEDGAMPGAFDSHTRLVDEGVPR